MCYTSTVLKGFSNILTRYENIKVGEPRAEEGIITLNRLFTPQECRLRDFTYSAPITVDIEYLRGTDRIFKKDVVIGR